MTKWSPKNGIVRTLLVVGTVALGVAGFAVIAPFIGFGRNEEFLLYRTYEIPRFQMFETSMRIFVVCMAALVVGHFAKTIGLATKSIGLAAYYYVVGRVLGVDKRTYRKAARWTAVAALLSIVASLLIGEFSARYIAYERYVSNPAIYTTLFQSENLGGGTVDSIRGINYPYSKIGLFKENRDVTLAYFGKGGRAIQSTTYRLNNVGLISQNDYAVARGPSEFRIVVLGGEQTAPTTAANPWPDKVQEILAADGEFQSLTGGRTPKVINFGWPDAGLLHYPQVWSRARKFNPDMVLINIASHDFARAPQSSPSNLDNDTKKNDTTPMLLDFSDRIGVSQKVIMWTECLSGPISLDNPTCKIGRPHTFFTDPSVFRDRERVGRLLDNLVSDYAGGAIWKSRQSILLRWLLGRSLDPEAIRRDHWPPGAKPPQPRPVLPVTDEEKLQGATKAIGTILSENRHILITRNVWFSEHFLKGDPFAMTRRLSKRIPEVRIVVMAERLPSGVDRKELETWYSVPHDDVKWSEKGHGIYAKAISKVVKEYIRDNPNVVGYAERFR